MSLLLLGAVAVGGGCDSGRDPPRGYLPPTTTTGSGTGGSGGDGTQFTTSTGGGPDLKIIADPEAPCDSGLDVADDDPVQAARAVGICKLAQPEGEWGLVAAKWTMIDGSEDIDFPLYHLGHGLLDGFGDEIGVLEGERLLALSSGTARQPGDPGYESPYGFDKGYSSSSPEGYPKESAACPYVVTGPPFDGVALELTLRAPSDALSLSFSFDFYTYEWPDFICSTYNDFFIAILEPTVAGQSDGNISFDQIGNPVSVNNAFVRVCGCSNGPPCLAPPENPQKVFTCELGPAELGGTGFEEHAATSWLLTKAPVEPGGLITLRFSVYDSGDHILDSTTLIDDFHWLGEERPDPETQPLPR